MTPKQFQNNRLSIISKKTGESLTLRELAHKLDLTPNTGHDYIRMIEKGKKVPSGALIGHFKLLLKMDAILKIVEANIDLDIVGSHGEQEEELNNAMIEIYKIIKNSDGK